MRLELPGCGVVEAEGEQAELLLAAGFRPTEPEGEGPREPAKGRARRATTKKSKDE